MRRLTPCILVVLVGCASAPVRARDPGLALLAPSEAGFEGKLVQSVTFSQGSRTFEATVVVEVASDAVHLVALSPLGARVLGLTWDGARLQREQDPRLPRELPSELVLRDLQLTFWPEAAIRRLLPAGWELKASARERVFLQDGIEIIRIELGEDRFRDPISFEHRSLGYRLSITQESSEDERSSLE